MPTYVILVSLPSLHLSVVIGGFSNSKSVINKGSGIGFPDFGWQSTPGILDATAFREFTISWTGGHIHVYKAWESLPFLAYNHSDPFPVNYVGFTTGWASTGVFRFQRCAFGKDYRGE